MSALSRLPDLPGPLSAYDFGGRDINGSVRSQLPMCRWQGVDIVAGPGVDLVRDLTDPATTLDPVDVIICTEVFEHVKDWPNIIELAARTLREDGPQVFIATCASTGRRPHGASGEADPPEGEWYANVPAEHLREELERRFLEVVVAYEPEPGDAYALARGVRSAELTTAYRRLDEAIREVARLEGWQGLLTDWVASAATQTLDAQGRPLTVVRELSPRADMLPPHRPTTILDQVPRRQVPDRAGLGAAADPRPAVAAEGGRP